MSNQFFHESERGGMYFLYSEWRMEPKYLPILKKVYSEDSFPNAKLCFIP